MRHFAWMVAILLFTAGVSKGQEYRSPNWNGYIQGRYTTDFKEIATFSIRRAKLWLKGKVPGTEHWQYKVQAIFRPQNQGSLILQDAYGEFLWNYFSLQIGQMVPAFSLQRYQPDYKIPLVERAGVINALIPTAESGARDIGLQLHWMIPHNLLEIYGGIFNGNGGNQVGNDDTNFLFTQHTIWHVVRSKDYRFQMGASFAYRKTRGMVLKKILGSSLIFHGRDVRLGVEGLLHIKNFLLQGEWLQARLEENRAEGYYLLASFLFETQHQWTFSIERYQDKIVQTVDHPWFIIGYNYRWHQDKAKLMLDGRFQKGVDEWHSQFTIQFQWFFN